MAALSGHLCSVSLTVLILMIFFSSESKYADWSKACSTNYIWTTQMNYEAIPSIMVLLAAGGYMAWSYYVCIYGDSRESGNPYIRWTPPLFISRRAAKQDRDFVQDRITAKEKAQGETFARYTSLIHSPEYKLIEEGARTEAEVAEAKAIFSMLAELIVCFKEGTDTVSRWRYQLYITSRRTRRHQGWVNKDLELEIKGSCFEIQSHWLFSNIERKVLRLADAIKQAEAKKQAVELQPGPKN